MDRSLILTISANFVVTWRPYAGRLMTSIRDQILAFMPALSGALPKRVALCMTVVSVLALSPPMWPCSDAGSALAEDGPLGVTRVAGNVTAADIAGASPMRAIKRFGAKQKNLLNRVAKTALGGKKSSRAGKARSMKPYRMRAANRALPGSRSPGLAVGGLSDNHSTMRGLGRHEYLRLAGGLSGQSCESIEGGVIVRRGC